MERNLPKGEWVSLSASRWRYQASGPLIYGNISLLPHPKDEFPYYWEANVILLARPEGTILEPITGFSPTLSSAMTIVETLLRETQTVKFDPYEVHVLVTHLGKPGIREQTSIFVYENPLDMAEKIDELRGNVPDGFKFRYTCLKKKVEKKGRKEC